MILRHTCYTISVDTTKKHPRRRARKSPDGEVRSKLIKLRVTPGEHEAIRKAAEYYQCDEVSEFIRKAIMHFVENADSGLNLQDAVSSAFSATAEDFSQSLDIDVEVKPAFKTYKVIDEIAEL